MDILIFIQSLKNSLLNHIVQLHNSTQAILNQVSQRILQKVGFLIVFWAQLVQPSITVYWFSSTGGCTLLSNESLRFRCLANRKNVFLVNVNE